jgi:hypothetical protein
MSENRIITVRASSWGSLFDCSYRWEGEHLLGMRRASSLRATLGTAIHAGTAIYDQAKLEGRRVSTEEAADAFVDALRNPEGEVDYRQDRDLNLNDAEVIGLGLTMKYCVEISPLFQYKSVEMKLDPFEIDCGNGITIRLTGTMDRARAAAGDKGVIIPDIKSGARIIENGEVALKGKGAQLGVYQMMYENTTGEHTIGGQIIGLQTTKELKTGVSRLLDGKRVMIGSEQEKGLVEMAAIMFKTGFFPPNPQSSLCSPKFCARWETCIYHD